MNEWWENIDSQNWSPMRIYYYKNYFLHFLSTNFVISLFCNLHPKMHCDEKCKDTHLFYFYYLMIPHFVKFATHRWPKKWIKKYTFIFINFILISIWKKVSSTLKFFLAQFIKSKINYLLLSENVQRRRRNNGNWRCG